MTSDAFRQAAYDFGSASPHVALTALAAPEADILGNAFAAIDPWRALGFAQDRMARFFASKDPAGSRFALRRDGVLAGFVCVDPGWLCGPYLHFLGVLPEHQGCGLGSAAIGWFLGQADLAQARNAWVCVSTFNAGARKLYAAQGFEEATVLDDLVQTGFAEVLMRKRLFVSSKS